MALFKHVENLPVNVMHLMIEWISKDDNPLMKNEKLLNQYTT